MSTPAVYDIPGGYRFIWSVERIQIKLSRFSDEKRGLTTAAELTISSEDPQVGGHLHQARLNLTSTSARTDLVRALAKLDDVTPWTEIVETVCVQGLALHRAGEPVVKIGGQRPLGQGVRYRLWPLCPDRMSTILFGEGGTGKSIIALLTAFCVQTGQKVLSLKPMKGNILYLDYETSADIMHERLLAIAAGMNVPAPQIAYRYCYRPLAEDIEALQEQIGDEAIDYLIVDSLGLACGGDPSDQELAIRMMGALRELKRGSLLIDHMAKSTTDKPTPFGSVYKPNLARSVWRARLGERTDEQHIKVSLYHKKVNFGPLRSAIGLDFTFTMNGEVTTSIAFSGFDVLRSDDQELLKDATHADRIEDYVSGGAKTVKEIAEALDIASSSVSQAIRRNSGRFQTMEGKRWGLKSRD